MGHSSDFGLRSHLPRNFLLQELLPHHHAAKRADQHREQETPKNLNDNGEDSFRVRLTSDIAKSNSTYGGDCPVVRRPVLCGDVNLRCPISIGAVLQNERV